MSYFNLEFNPQMATSLVHCLNRRYRGARKFPVTAPDAQGTLYVWARDPEECREHLLNALFDLLFARNRVGAAVSATRHVSSAEEKRKAADGTAPAQEDGGA